MTPLDTSNCTAEQKALILEHATDLRKFEIERFWSRSLIFWGFITTALVAFGAAEDVAELQMLAACYGFLCALAWTLQNRGSKYWHESWEAKVETVERDVLGTNLFSNKEPIKSRGAWLQARRFSSSRLVMIMSDFTCLAMVGLIYAAAQTDVTASLSIPKLITVASTAVGSILLLLEARSQ